jgi:IrrE N-terminal-like domain
MDVDEAISICSENFPDGLKIVAERLKAEVIYDNLGTCDGWCVRRNSGGAVIRINWNLPVHRQRSTLAHEIGHLLDGSRTQIYGSLFAANSIHERRAFEIGNSLLLPPKILFNLVPKIPLDSRALKKIAEEANVSQVITAIQFAKLAPQLDIEAIAVVGFKDDKPAWFPVPSGISGIKEIALRVQEETGLDKRRVSRFDNYFGFAIENFFMPTVLVQKLSDEQIQVKTDAEVVREFELNEFPSPKEFQIFQGRIGALKDRIVKDENNLTFLEMVDLFLEKYRGKWQEDFEQVISSEKGLEYLKIRFMKWFPETSK